MNQPTLQEQLKSIEHRLSRIEKILRISNSNPWVKEDTPSQQPLPTPPKPNDLEVNSANWLGVIAIICFVVAAAFIIKLSIASGWLTPERQLGLSALFGIGLIIAGFILLKSDRSYASLLPGAGIIILYLTTFAANSYYFLITFEYALALTALISVLCIWLYTKIKMDIYAITAALGAYLAPVILSMYSGLAMNSGILFSLYYFLICSVAFGTISIWLKSRSLILISSYLAILMSSLIGIFWEQDILTAGVLAVQFLIFAACTYLYTLKNLTPLTNTDSWSFLPILLLFYAVEYYLLDRVYPGFAPWISLGFAVFLIALYFSAKKYFPDNLNSQAVILAYVSIVCFHSIYLELLPYSFHPWLFGILLFAIACLPFNFSTQTNKDAFLFPKLAVLIILILEYYSIVSHLLDEREMGWLPVAFFSLAALWFVLAFAQKKLSISHSNGNLLLCAAHLLAVEGLYRLTFNISSLAVSVSWLLYAVAVMVLAFYRKDKSMAKSALLVLALAAGKALLYDAASAATIVRILCLLLTGAVLYICGLFMRKINHWQK